MRPRALMIPPGFPDFLTRARIVEAGAVELGGRAWSGLAPITRVEVGVDSDWRDATLAPAHGEFAWRAWSAPWVATRGSYTLRCRAHDAAGNVQPLEAPWNLQGMGNNLVQAIPVTVR